MTISRGRGWRGVATFVIAAALSGCAAQSPALNSFADGSERADAGRIIERALTAPMPALAQRAQSGNDNDKLAYADALIFGRAADGPGASLSDLPPFDDTRPPVPPGVDDEYVSSSPARKDVLLAWSRQVANRLLACTTTCDIQHYGQPTHVPEDKKAPVGLYEGHVISDNWRCAASVRDEYKHKLVLDILLKEMSNSSGKRRALARHLFVDFRLTAMLDGPGMYDCDGNFAKYAALYGRLNPQLESILTVYLDQELDDKAANPYY